MQNNNAKEVLPNFQESLTTISHHTNMFIEFLDFFLHYMNAWNLLPYGNKCGHTRTSVFSTAENKEFSLQPCRITASHSLIVPIISWLSKYLTCPKSTLLWFSALKFVLVEKKSETALSLPLSWLTILSLSALLPSPSDFPKLFSKFSSCLSAIIVLSEKLGSIKKWGNSLCIILYIL